MPVQPGPIPCPKCGEDRPTLIHQIIDPRGMRYVCMVCSHEFVALSSRAAVNIR